MAAKWVKFTGCKDELIKSAHGFVLSLNNGSVFKRLGPGDFLKFGLEEIPTHYLIHEPKAHEGMIIEWARTGREVEKWSDRYTKWLDDPSPTWEEQGKYRFKKPEDVKEKKNLFYRNYLDRIDLDIF